MKTPEQLRELADRLEDPAECRTGPWEPAGDAADELRSIASALEAVGVEPVAGEACEFVSDCRVVVRSDYDALALRLAEALRQRDVLLEFYLAAASLQMTLGHEDATLQDEQKAEARYDAASRAAYALGREISDGK